MEPSTATLRKANCTQGVGNPNTTGRWETHATINPFVAMVVFMMLTALPAASAQVHPVSQATCASPVAMPNAGAFNDVAKANTPAGGGPIPLRVNPNFDKSDIGAFPGNGGLGGPGGFTCEAKSLP